MIKGVDISHWQGTVDHAKLKADGNEFVIAKADDGVGGTDAFFARNREEAHKHGLIFGSYHFFHAAQDIDAQVAHYEKVIGARRPNELPPCLDWEPANDDRRISHGAMKPRALEFLQKISAIAKCDPFLYASPGVLASFGDLSAFAKYPLWIAHYGVNHPHVPAPWKTFTIWQYTDKGGLDLDLFNGSLDQLKKFCLP